MLPFFISRYAVCLILVLMPIFLYWGTNTFLETLFTDFCEAKDVSAAGGNSALRYGVVGCNDTKFTNLRTSMAEAFNVR